MNFSDFMRTIVATVASLALAGVGGLTAWSFRMTERVTTVETHIGAQSKQLDRLEHGDSTPISNEAKARFEAVAGQLRTIEGQLSKLDAGIQEITRRMLDKRADGKPPSIGMEPKGG